MLLVVAPDGIAYKEFVLSGGESILSRCASLSLSTSSPAPPCSGTDGSGLCSSSRTGGSGWKLECVAGSGKELVSKLTPLEEVVPELLVLVLAPLLANPRDPALPDRELAAANTSHY